MKLKFFFTVLFYICIFSFLNSCDSRNNDLAYPKVNIAVSSENKSIPSNNIPDNPYSKDWCNKKSDLTESFYPGFEIRFPKNYLTSELLKHIKNIDKKSNLPGVEFYPTFRFGHRGSYPSIENIKYDEILPQMIMTSYNGKCAWCKKPFRGFKKYLNTKKKGTLNCCGVEVYCDVSKMAEKDLEVLDKSLKVPCPDGSFLNIRYCMVGGKAYIPSSLLASTIINKTLSADLPRLTWSVCHNKNTAAAKALVRLLDGLIPILKGLPWTTDDLRFLSYKDLPDFLPKSVNLKTLNFDISSDRLLSSADYLKLFQALNKAKINRFGTAKFRPAIMNHLRKTIYASFSEAWSSVKDLPSTRQYSRNKYGNELELEKLFVDALKMHSAFLRHNDFNNGNFVVQDFARDIPLSVVVQDKKMAENIVMKILDHFYCHFSTEGISTEGSFNYALMMSAAFHKTVLKEAYGIDLTKKFPWTKQIYNNGPFPLVTLSNIESQHADNHNAFFASNNLYPPDKIDYSKAEKSITFPEYGLSCLRSGKEGSRMEVIMSHQNSILHTDPDRLAIQLFYEGVNLMPDIGYMKYNSDIKKYNKLALDPKMEVTESPEKKWFDYSDSPYTHNNAIINGLQPGLQTTKLERFFGGHETTNPSYIYQFVQVDGSPVYYRHKDPVETYNRQLLTLQLPKGRSLLLDFYRLQGGRRHSFYWHAPADKAITNLGTGKVIEENNLHEYLTKNATPVPGWGKNEDHILRYFKKRNWPYKDDFLKMLEKPVKWSPNNQKSWYYEWYVKPDRYYPKLKGGNEEWEKWSCFQQSVSLRIWNVPEKGDYKEELFNSQGPWCSKLVGFGGLQYKNGLNYLISNRQGAANLKSNYIHVLEPRTEKQKTLIENITNLTESSEEIAIKIDLEGRKSIYAGSSLSSGSFNSENFSFKGRVAVKLDNSGSAFLYDGEELTTNSFTIKTEPSIIATLVGLRGDLTGEHDKSSIYVKTTREIPTGEVLKGHMIYVEHLASQRHRSSYQIKDITKLRDGIYRINLKNNPRFTLFRFKIHKLNPDTKTIEADRDVILGSGRPYLKDRLAYFPDSGFKTSVVKTNASGWRAWSTKLWTISDWPKNQIIKNDDTIIIYSINKGDEVIIPSYFSSQREGQILKISCSGESEITLSEDTIDLPHGIKRNNLKEGKYKFTVSPGIHELKMR